VLYDVEERSGFQQEPLKTASVGIRTTSGTELDAVRAHGIRVLVASSIAGLEPERVAVTDLSTGKVFAGALEDPTASATVAPELARRFANETALAGRIRQALAFVRGVIVDVAIDATPLPTTDSPLPTATDPSEPPIAAAANAPAELLPPAPPPSRQPVAPGAPVGRARPRNDNPEIPGVVHVTVSIPDNYLAAAVEASKARLQANLSADSVTAPAADTAAAAEDHELERLREIVERALSSFDSPDRLRVLVTSYPAMVPDATERRAEALDGPRPLPANRSPAADVTIHSEVDIPPSHHPLPDLPREAWLAATSVLVGILAGFLWWAGSRSSGRPEESLPGWKASDDDRASVDDDRRLAA
jgi:hypothetical protein